MEAIKSINVEAYNYLAAIPTCHWSRHGFNTSSKSGMLLNNCCESFNNVLREARTKPIIQCMEWIRRYVMQRFCSKREGSKTFEGVIMPSVVKMVHKGLDKVSSMRVRQADLQEFEVDHELDTFVVNLESRHCGCYRWSLMGIPCWHALACIQLRRLKYEDFIHPAYHVETYAKAYAPTFKAMLGHNQWDTTQFPKPLPPPYRKMVGRPKLKKRKKEAGEGEEQQQVKRAKKQNKCSRCGGLGHYKSSCRMPAPLADHGQGGQKEKAGSSQKVGPVAAKPTQEAKKRLVASKPASKKGSVPAKPGPVASKPASKKGSMPAKPGRVASKKGSSTLKPPSKPKSGGTRKLKPTKEDLNQPTQSSQVSISSSGPPSPPTIDSNTRMIW
ncbi:uncharacterized protein LOC125495592 [Beta vulgaris subsp. vulgaris]|uniref:uncharacterized protein LOC125495592 n=1 Tax=Beta vulgaris subsp. vulgaris TaxID=3555 RepID=UPI002036F749|nr:uncharacterized protein LOC125495592 [Beta vulgaris subsp. vulgaris]